MAAAQRERKAKLDAGRVDTVFQVGDRVLLRTKELDAADIGKLRPRWDGPFTVKACPGPNAYTLALPRRMPKCGAVRGSTSTGSALPGTNELVPLRRRVRCRTRG